MADPKITSDYDRELMEAWDGRGNMPPGWRSSRVFKAARQRARGEAARTRTTPEVGLGARSEAARRRMIRDRRQIKLALRKMIRDRPENRFPSKPDKPGNFVPTVKLDASRVTDWRKPIRDPKERGNSQNKTPKHLKPPPPVLEAPRPQAPRRVGWRKPTPSRQPRRTGIVR